jgi:cytochrome P450
MHCPVHDRFADPQVIENPYDYFREVRENDPVFFSKAHGGYVISRYEDLVYVIAHPELFQSEPPKGSDVSALFDDAYRSLYSDAGVPPQMPTICATDGAQAKRYRRIVDHLSISEVKKYEARAAERVDRIIDGFIEEGRADLYAEICKRLPLEMMCDILGLPTDAADLLGRSSETVVQLIAGRHTLPEEEIVRLHESQVEFHGFLMDNIERIRAEPDGNLIDIFNDYRDEDGTKLSDAELVSLLSTFNIGGNDTTVNGLGSVFLLCIRNGLEQQLHDNEALIPRFIEEALRAESPVIMLTRFASQDTEVAGTKIEKDAVVYLNYFSANQDEAQFADARRMDLDRKGLRSHVAFGHGLHYCAGANFARLQMKVALQRVLARLKSIRIEAPEQLSHAPTLTIRALNALPVAFEKRGAA